MGTRADLLIDTYGNYASHSTIKWTSPSAGAITDFEAIYIVAEYGDPTLTYISARHGLPMLQQSVGVGKVYTTDAYIRLPCSTHAKRHTEREQETERTEEHLLVREQ